MALPLPQIPLNLPIETVKFATCKNLKILSLFLGPAKNIPYLSIYLCYLQPEWHFPPIFSLYTPWCISYGKLYRSLNLYSQEFGRFIPSKL